MTEEKYISLLSKHLTGEISAEEASALREWLGQSPENQALAAEIEAVWEKTGAYSPKMDPDLEKAFQKVQARIQATGPDTAPMRAQWGKKIWRYAAAAALLVAAFGGLHQVLQNGQASPEQVLTANAPSGNSLPDGSKVWLRTGSQLRYLPFGESGERTVSLEGEGYFEVEHDPARPFKVALRQGGCVEVLGTAFDVRQSEGETTVIVRSGRVRFSPETNAQSVVLEARQKATYNLAAHQMRTSEALSLNELSWQTGGLEFVGTPLHLVLQDIEGHHGVKVVLENKALQNCPYTAPLSTQPAEKLLAALAVAFQLELTKSPDGAFVLRGGSCN